MRLHEGRHMAMLSCRSSDCAYRHDCVAYDSNLTLHGTRGTLLPDVEAGANSMSGGEIRVEFRCNTYSAKKTSEPLANENAENSTAGTESHSGLHPMHHATDDRPKPATEMHVLRTHDPCECVDFAEWVKILDDLRREVRAGDTALVERGGESHRLEDARAAQEGGYLSDRRSADESGAE